MQFGRNWWNWLPKLVILTLSSLDCIFSESKNGPKFKIDHFSYQFHQFLPNWMDNFGKLVILTLGSFDCIFSESNNGRMFKIDHFGNQFHHFQHELAGKVRNQLSSRPAIQASNQPL